MDRFRIEIEKWYAWQMLPGYIDTPFFSPIYMKNIKPFKTGNGIINLVFFNAAYAEGVQNFSVDLHVIKRTDSYFIGEYLNSSPSPERSAIISDICFGWLSLFFPSYIEQHPPYFDNDEDVQAYLSRNFRVA